MESVENNTPCKIVWTVLALDNPSCSSLNVLNKPNLEVIHVDEFPDSELQALKLTRAWEEFCWTSAACLLNYCLTQTPSGQRVAYIDADCFFFEDIHELLKPLEAGSKITIHEHRYSRDRLAWLQKSGRFNVGLVAGVNEPEFKTCIGKWRRQVLNRCDVNHLEGRCGDQTYLNEWPALYPSLHILRSPGAGLAPWNIKNHKVSTLNGILKVDSQPLYFYHFSALKFIYISKYFALFIPAAGYLNMNSIERVIYTRYVAHLMRICATIGRTPQFTFELKLTLANVLKGRAVFKVGRF